MPRPRIDASYLLAALAIALAAFAIAATLRESGTLERVDLSIDDAMVRTATHAGTDERFFVILEREDDLARWGFPLPDAVLARLVDTVLAAQPLALGIDKYRDKPVPAGSTELDTRLARGDRVYWVSKFGLD